MVKFAEAEKRGRGGDGGDRRYAPVVMVERAKMSRAMWESLKAHIIRDRKRKKEEQEADAEEERLRKERETRKKQHAMTLEETREKITQMEQDLSDLKKQKHQLFQELKVVLNEDDTRKRAQQQQQQQNYLKESELVAVHPYPHAALPLSGHPQMLFQSSLVPGRGPIHSYKVPTPSQPQPLVPPGSLKRARTPSPQPPPQASYQQIYTLKNLPGHPPPPSVPVTPPTTKTSCTTNVYVTGQAPTPYYHSQSQPHANPTAAATPYQRPASQGVTYLPPSNPQPPPSQPPPPQPQPPPPQPREEKHLQPVYLQTSRGAHVPTLHPSLDHKGKAGGGAFLPGGDAGGAVAGAVPVGAVAGVPSAGQEKYFQSSVRSHHLALHSAVLPVQQPHPAGAKSGSITSGFPVRSAPSASSAQPTVVSSAPHPVKPENKPRIYSTAPTNYARGPYY